jgi:hypothetical protein
MTDNNAAKTELDFTSKTPRHEEAGEIETAKHAKSAKSPDSALLIPLQSLTPSPRTPTPAPRR